jgi:hypothetical protein
VDLEKYKYQIIDLCRKYKVKDLYVFGSVLTRDFHENSDIDFIVDILSEDPLEYAENYFNLKFQLEELLNIPVDLLEKRALKNRYFLEQVEKNKRIIYEA